MRMLFSTLSFLAAISLAAQTPTTSTAPIGSATTPQRNAVQPVMPAQNRIGAVNPSLRTPNQRPIVGGFSNAPSPVQATLPNRFGTTNEAPFRADNSGLPNNGLSANAPVWNIAGVLNSLQSEMEQALPALMAMTAQAPHTGASGAVIIDGALVPVPRPGTPVPGRREVFTSIGTNNFAVAPETYRLLTILENDLRQTLPVLRVLNGTVVTRANNAPAGFADRFAPLTNAPATLFPTGR